MHNALFVIVLLCLHLAVACTLLAMCVFVRRTEARRTTMGFPTATFVQFRAERGLAVLRHLGSLSPQVMKNVRLANLGEYSLQPSTIFKPVYYDLVIIVTESLANEIPWQITILSSNGQATDIWLEVVKGKVGPSDIFCHDPITITGAET